MANRISALQGHIALGQHGDKAGNGVSLTVLENLSLHQVAAWPETMQQVGQLAANSMGHQSAPLPRTAKGNSQSAILRVETLKWWLIGTQEIELTSELGACLDMSHSRSRIRISGSDSVALLNRLMPLDLREHSFAKGSVASTAIHHVGITLWRNERGYELFIPRSFALSVWEVIFKSALQFGVDVRQQSIA
ncbi:MAG: heterotetrameric sarcosine oxidase gamma subunit [Cryomorphaceae bacterium]|jgi:heterotetrameric sarcosine oxidase gamma subunit